MQERPAAGRSVLAYKAKFKSASAKLTQVTTSNEKSL